MTERGDLSSPPSVYRDDGRGIAAAVVPHDFAADALPDGQSTVPAEHGPYRPKRGRPTPATVAAIDHAILAAATRQFLTDGYDGSSMEAIATSAGVSKGTLYNRYADKEALLRAVVADSIERWSIEASRRDLVPDNKLERRLKRHVDAIMTASISGEFRAFGRLIAGTSGVPPETVRALHDHCFSSVIEVLERAIRECTQADGTPARDARKIALSLIAMLNGWFQIEGVFNRNSEDDAIAFGRHSVDLLIEARHAW